MGFPISFNWVLQIHPPEDLKQNCSYEFKKPTYRVFPINTPIDLIDIDRNAIAKIKIKSFANENDQTTGVFEVIKIYREPEKDILSNYWRENQ